MLYKSIYKEKLNCNNDDEVFNYLIDNLKETIRGWNFFVDWGKVFKNINKIEIRLNILNYLIGKDNIREEFKVIIMQYPEVVEVLPILLALREKSIKILDINAQNNFNYNEYEFNKCKKLSNDEADKIAEFAEKTGLLEIFKDKKIKNIVDYVTGIEVGLDTNARKNRSGTSMEHIVELFVRNMCSKYGYKYLKQATSSKIKNQLGYNVIVDKSDRKFDFVIDNGKKLYLVETNFFGGEGSKLKSVAGEFINLFNFIKNNTPEHDFIWITDGKGWRASHRPLREAFDKIDYLLNISMLEKGIFEEILK